MKLDPAALATVTVAFKPNRYQRVFSAAYKANPLGTGPGMARFSSLHGNFNTLYAAANLATAIAETVVRDRFEGGGARLLFARELSSRCVAPISADHPLALVDLRDGGCFPLGVSTDITGAKGSATGWPASRELAQHVHDHSSLDGFLYRSRLTGRFCVAVFDRAVVANLKSGPVRALFAAPHLLKALEALRVEVIR